MATEIAALRARVKTLESENGKLASTLRKQESASRTMTESLQGELARIQHLCNELSYTMVLQGVDPSVLSAVTSKHLRFDPAVRARNRSPSFSCLPPSHPSAPRTLRSGSPAAHDAGCLRAAGPQGSGSDRGGGWAEYAPEHATERSAPGGD